MAWHDYLRLMRVPNVFTAVADSAMGFLLIAEFSQAPDRFSGAVLASASLYAAGMVLNDYFDLELDRQERPERPLPSGRIPPRHALGMGLVLLLVGAVAGNLAGCLPGRWISVAGCLALVLANVIFYYDRRLKGTPAGPPAMGACRALNVWMAATIGLAAFGRDALPNAFPIILVVFGFGIYTAGITAFARDEAQHSDSGRLLGAAGVMAAGLTMVALFPFAGGPSWLERLRIEPVAWPLLVLVLAAAPMRRWWLAYRHGDPQRVQLAVKQSILFLVVLDAAIVLALHGPYWGVAVLALLLPASLLGRYFPST